MLRWFDRLFRVYGLAVLLGGLVIACAQWDTTLNRGARSLQRSRSGREAGRINGGVKTKVLRPLRV